MKVWKLGWLSIFGLMIFTSCSGLNGCSQPKIVEETQDVCQEVFEEYYGFAMELAYMQCVDQIAHAVCLGNMDCVDQASNYCQMNLRIMKTEILRECRAEILEQIFEPESSGEGELRL